MSFLIGFARFHWFWACCNLKSVRLYLANTVHKSFVWFNTNAWTTLSFKCHFCLSHKTWHYGNPTSFTERQAHVKPFSCRFLAGWSFGPFSWSVNTQIDQDIWFCESKWHLADEGMLCKWGEQIVRTAFLLWFALDQPYGEKFTDCLD